MNYKTNTKLITKKKQFRYLKNLKGRWISIWFFYVKKLERALILNFSKKKFLN